MIVLCAESKTFICKTCKVKSNVIIFPITPNDLVKLSARFRSQHLGCLKENCTNCKHIGKETKQTKFGPVEYFTCSKNLNGVSQKESKRRRTTLQDENYRQRQKACFEGES